MPKIDLDLLDIGGSFIGHTIKRLFIFFATGFVGVLIGYFCIIFTEWNDFLNAEYALSKIEFDELKWWFLYWPLVVPIYYVYLALFLYPFFGFALLRMIVADLLPVFTLLIVAFLCSLGLVINESNLVSWCVFSFVFPGYIAVAWQLCKIYAPEVIEKVSDLLKFGTGERAYDTSPPAPAKKVDLKVWGENVKLESEDWDDD